MAANDISANINCPCVTVTAAKDKSKLIWNLIRQQLLVVALKGHLYLVANRWQCAQKNMLLRTRNWWFHTQGWKVTEETRGKRKNKSGNWEDPWSNETNLFSKIKSPTQQLQTLPSLLPHFKHCGESTECKSAAAQTDLRYCKMAKEQINRDCAKRKGKQTLTRPWVKETNRDEQIGGAMKRGPDEGENKLVGWFNIA